MTGTNFDPLFDLHRDWTSWHRNSVLIAVFRYGSGALNLGWDSLPVLRLCDSDHKFLNGWTYFA